MLWWRNRRAFVVMGIVVTSPFVVASELLVKVRPAQSAVLVGLSVILGTTTVLEEAICSGLAEHILRDDVLGRPQPPLRHQLRALPLGRLIVVALLTGIAVLVGLVLCVLPGLAAFAWLALATPLVSFERVGAMSAIRGSVSLVRGRFWPVAVLTTVTFVPAVLLDEVATVVRDVHAPLWTEIVVEVIGEAVIITLTAAVVVALFNALRGVGRGGSGCRSTRRSVGW
jgi:hypothetical protein